MDLTFEKNQLPPIGSAALNIFKISIPACVTLISTLVIELINASFAGHIGNELMMAGVGIANMQINVLLFSVTQGVNSTLNTLISQAYGLGNLHLCGVYLNRSRIIGLLIAILELALLLNTEIIFIAFGFDPEMCHYC